MRSVCGPSWLYFWGSDAENDVSVSTEWKCRNRKLGNRKKKAQQREIVFSRAKLERVEEEDMAEQIWFRGGSMMWGTSWRNEPLMILLGIQGLPLFWLDEEGHFRFHAAVDNVAFRVDTWFVFSTPTLSSGQEISSTPQRRAALNMVPAAGDGERKSHLQDHFKDIKMWSTLVYQNQIRHIDVAIKHRSLPPSVSWWRHKNLTGISNFCFL